MVDCNRCVSSYYTHKYKTVVSLKAAIAVGTSFHVHNSLAGFREFLLMV